MKPSNCGTGQTVYLGKGVLQAVGNVNGEIAESLGGCDAADQRTLDARLIELDGTPNKGRLERTRFWRFRWRGAGFGEACELPLYRYLAERRERVAGADDEHPERRRSRDNNVDFQEFMVMPVGAPSFSERCAGVWKFFIRSRAC